MMSCFWSLLYAMNLSSCSIRLRRSASRPVNAVLNACVMSWTLPSPPPLSSNEIAASVCSVVGYAPADDSGITDPSRNRPSGGTSLGTESSMCWLPSRLVWPTLAVALAGSTTLALSFMVTRACQPSRSIPVTLPTVTSSTRTREFCSMLSTSGICALTVYAPGPSPCTPGNGTEFSPPAPQPDTTTDTAAVSTANRISLRLIMTPDRSASSTRVARQPDWSRSAPRRAAVGPAAALHQTTATLDSGWAPDPQEVRSPGASIPRCR